MVVRTSFWYSRLVLDLKSLTYVLGFESRRLWIELMRDYLAIADGARDLGLEEQQREYAEKMAKAIRESRVGAPGVSAEELLGGIRDRGEKM